MVLDCCRHSSEQNFFGLAFTPLGSNEFEQRGLAQTSDTPDFAVSIACTLAKTDAGELLRFGIVCLVALSLTPLLPLGALLGGS
jgi:hypothetical protein